MTSGWPIKLEFEATSCKTTAFSVLIGFELCSQLP